MKPGLPILLVMVGLVACACRPSPGLSSSQVSQESATQQQFKNKLKGMTPDQIAEVFRKNPQQARALLMPPGMGNPALRLKNP